MSVSGQAHKADERIGDAAIIHIVAEQDEDEHNAAEPRADADNMHKSGTDCMANGAQQSENNGEHLCEYSPRHSTGSHCWLVSYRFMLLL